MKKTFKLILSLLTLFFIHHSMFPSSAAAVCPVCTIAVGAGLGISRWLGIDDAVSGVWVGGIILSSTFWLIDWLDKKQFKSLSFYYSFQYKKWLIAFAMYALVIIPLFTSGIIGHPFNTILGIDKLIFGTAVGSFAFLAGMYLDKKVREVKGKQLFSFQKVAFPLGTLIIASLILFVITSVKIAFV